jgi:hypothetical protein
VDAFYDKYLSKKITRAEHYKQNKDRCRRLQKQATSFKKNELGEWVLPEIQSLNNGQAIDSSISEEERKLFEQFGIEPTVRKVISENDSSPAKQSEEPTPETKPALDTSAFNLKFKNDEERALYERNGIIPDEIKHPPASAVPLKFRKQIEAQEREMRIKAGKSPVDVEWELFEESELITNPPDHDISEQHLDKYIELLSRSEMENICYERFLDFSKGRNKIKNFSFAEKMLKEISDTRDADKLLDIVSYFEQRRDLAKAEPFYFTLYEVFHRGEGIQKDLTSSRENSPAERRDESRIDNQDILSIILLLEK